MSLTQDTAAAQSQSKRLKLSVKLLFGAGSFYNGSINLLNFFYAVLVTDIIQLNPLYAGPIFLITKIWDAIIDPLFGDISDMTVSRHGRRRVFYLYGMLPVFISFFLMWYPVKLNTEIARFMYVLGTCLLFRTVYGFITVPYNSMKAEMSMDYHERNIINVICMMFSTSAEVHRKLAAYLEARREDGTEDRKIYESLSDILLEKDESHKLLKFLKLGMIVCIGRHKVYGMENVVDSGAVFICNHLGWYGPVAMNLFFPLKSKPWVDYRAVLSKYCSRHLEEHFTTGQLGLKPPFSRWLAVILMPFCIAVMKAVMAIPVYRINNEILRTFSLSVNALCKGYNIVIFPESHEKYSEYVNDFHTGFVHIARQYYTNSGKVLRFYPVYIDKKKKTITIGKSIEYTPEASFRGERNRIGDYLKESINDIAIIRSR